MKIGLVLAGGVSKGAYEIGFVEALLEKINYEDIKIISGASIGAINAYAIATKKIDVIKSIYRKINTKGILKLMYKVYIKHVIRHSIDELITPNEDVIQVPFYANLTKFPIFHPEYHRFLGNVNKSMRRFFGAALCYPVLAGAPKFLSKRLCFDGGAADNIPIFPLLYHKDAPPSIKGFKDYDLDLIIILHFDARYDFHEDNEVGDAPIIDLDCSIDNKFEKKHYDFTTENIDKMLKCGYEYGKKICNKIFKNRDATIEDYYQIAEEIYREEHPARSTNISWDRPLTMLNKFGYLFRKANKCFKIYRTRRKKYEMLQPTLPSSNQPIIIKEDEENFSKVSKNG